MNLEAILNFLSKFRSFFHYLLGYFMGAKVERLTAEQQRLKKEAKQKEDLYAAIHNLDIEFHKRRLEYDRVRKERGDKPYIIDL